ncbi:hypothetical protein AB0K09_30810 [Streptomyces sp. NPDC049577]|uniref:hypothetical protein n=1 Tax=Streptomyces sp. NPDC049577 TaxID=3155153 RepID=UPI0034130DFD
MPPDYDFAAADQLGRQLAQLVDKLDWLINLRTGRRKALLGTAHSDNWQGGKRNKFESEFARQQAALIELKAAARTLQASVAHATEQAHAARKNGN